MRIAGINAAATLTAAIAVYAVGFIIYGLILDPDAWMASQGITQAQIDAVGTTRMAYSLLMPIVTAIGMGMLFSWGNVSGLANGIKWGALVACLSALPAIWYGWVYGVFPISGPLIDSAHLLIGHCTAGAILASWK